MYGYQGNNSQSYNYQNPNGSFGNISQYAGPYHPYYSNATTSYNAFPSNATPCSSLGIIPQEYNQAGNGIPRPYFYDTNSSYTRPYQGLPFNQSMDLPIANSFNTCPRNCHCCEPLKPNFFNPDNAVPQQASVKNPYEPTLNAAYSGLRKSFDTSTWRECNPQMQNLKDANDSATSWAIPKYGNGYKNETIPWPLPQRQTNKFEGTERLSSTNNYILSQQHQRILPKSQTYSSMHSNSLRPMPTTCPSPGGNEDLLGTSLVGYQCSSFSDLPQNNSEPCSYTKSSVNSEQTSSRTAYNLPCGSTFSCRYSTSQVISENQKCIMETPKVIAPLSGSLVDSFQRHFVTHDGREEVKNNSYYQSGMLSSTNSINAQTRGIFNAQNESDTTLRMNCNSNESFNPVATSRLQLPPIQSLRPSMLLRHSSREFDQDHYHPTSKSGQQNLNEESGTKLRRSTSLANSPMRNLSLNTTHKYCDSTQPENFNKTVSGDRSIPTVLNGVYRSHYLEEQGKESFSNSRLTEVSSKLNLAENSESKLTSSSVSSGISDLRHFLSTWDDVDEEDTPSSAQDAVFDGNTDICSEEISVVTEIPSHIYKQLENSNSSSKANGSVPDVSHHEFPNKGVSYPVDHSPQFTGHNVKSDSFLKSPDFNETAVKEYELKNDTANERKEQKEITSQYQAKKSSYSELSTYGDLSNCPSASQLSKCLGTDSLGCTSFLALNTCESEMGYIDAHKVPSEEKILETRKRKKEFKKIIHSSDGTSLKILSLDLAVQGSSFTQNKSKAFKIQNCAEDTKNDVPLMQKTFFSCDSNSERELSDHQNGTFKGTESEGTIISSQKSSIETSNEAKSESISSESDTMVFYNLTARVDVTLERLEVPSISVNEKNDYSAHMLKANSHIKKAQVSEVVKKDISESICSETALKGNEECNFTSSANDDVCPIISKETDHDFEVIGSSSIDDESKSKIEDSDINCKIKNSHLIASSIDEFSIKEQNVSVGLDHSDHERMIRINEGNYSKDANLIPEVSTASKLPRKGTDENQGKSLDCIKTDSFRGEDIVFEVNEISEVHTKYINWHERTSPYLPDIHEFEKTAANVLEIPNKIEEEEILDTNKIYGRIAENFEKEANEHEKGSVGSKIHHVEETAPVTEVVRASEMPYVRGVSERSLLAKDVAENIKVAGIISDMDDITETPSGEADKHGRCLRFTEVCSLKEIELMAKVNSISDCAREGLNEHEESFISNYVAHDSKGIRVDPECKEVSEKLRKEMDELSCKSFHPCKKRKVQKSVPKLKDGQKYTKTPNKNFFSRRFRKTTCKSVLCIRRKYHFFRLGKDKSKNYPMIIPKISKVKKNCNSNNISMEDCNRNIKDFDMVSDGNRNLITDDAVLNDCIADTENMDALPAGLRFSKKIIENEGSTSSHYLCCSNNDRESTEGNVILNAEEKEIVLEGHKESCVIGNVEVFMGIDAGESNTMEENEKGYSFASGPPIKELLEEDTVGVQYWNNYELDNSLGVAMEVEVGSVIESDADEMVLLDSVKVEDTANSESNTKAVCLAEENPDKELLETSSKINGVSNKKTDTVISPKEEICAFSSKKEAEVEVVCSPENRKSLSFHGNQNNHISDSIEAINDTDLDNGHIIDYWKSTKIPSPSNIFPSLSENYSKLIQDTSLLPNNASDKNESLEVNAKEPVEGRYFETKSDLISSEKNTFKISKGLQSLSKVRQFQHNARKKIKAIIGKDGNTEMRSNLVCSRNLRTRKKKSLKKEPSAHFFTSKMKMLHKKRKVSKKVTKINIESPNNCIFPYGVSLVDGFSVKKGQFCEKSDDKVVSTTVDEKGDQVKIDKRNIISKCRVKEAASHVSNEIRECNIGKKSTSCEENHKECDISSKGFKHTNGIFSPCAKLSENFQCKSDEFLTAQDKIVSFTTTIVSEHVRGNERKRSSGCLQEFNVKSNKMKDRKKIRYACRPTPENYFSISRSHLHKFARHGFWKAKKWPYNCFLYRNKPFKKFGSPAFSALEKNTLPLILESYPNPPFLSPLPAYTDASDTYELSFSSSKTLKMHSNEESFQSIHDQLSENLQYNVQSKSESPYQRLCIPKDSKKSILPIPVTNCDSSEITYIQQYRSSPNTKYMTKEQHRPVSPKSVAEFTEETKNIDPGEKEFASSENDFSVSSNINKGSEANESPIPHVCITLKKIGIADRNEKQIKTIQDEFAENQKFRKGQSIQNKIDHSFESPLPKVTIKKKNGEGGYQSFLSGFSSYSPIPSSPVTPTPHVLIAPNSDYSNAEEPQDMTKETCQTHVKKSSHSECSLKSNASDRDIKDVYPKRKCPAIDEVQSGMVEKKAGSGLVFVIRGFGNHAKEDHLKKQKDVSCNQIEMSDRDAILSQISENYISSEDEGLESVPWSIWQPVVKLSRSCELDALARELCNPDEDTEIGDSSIKQQQHSKFCFQISGSEITQSSIQEANIKSESGSSKSMKDCSNGKDSAEGKGRLKRKDSEKKVELVKKQTACIRNLYFENPKKQAQAVVSEKPPKKFVHEKSFDAALQQIEEVEEKKMQHDKGKISSKVLNEPFKQVMCIINSDNEEKNYLQSNLTVPIPPLKIKSETDPIVKRKEKIDASINLQKENAKKFLMLEENTDIEEFFCYVKDEPKNIENFMKMSNECSSSPEYKNGLGRENGVAMHKEVLNGKNKMPSTKQDIHSKKSSKEKSAHISNLSEKDSRPSVQRKRNCAPQFQCEACCRRFSSAKWLSRHCKGLSHIRVENAQRLAVQALLLLLTGDESKSLRPLSEVELANLKTWSSHSAPSPLQVALKELLHPAKDPIL